MEKAIKWDNRVNTMAKANANASILAIWRHKDMAQNVLNAMSTLIEIMMRIAFYDIDKVREHIADIVRNNNIEASEF